MPTKRTSPTKKSPGKTMKKDLPGERANVQAKPARAQRQDTPEARGQRQRTPKTHPRRSATSTRKGRSKT